MKKLTKKKQTITIIISTLIFGFLLGVFISGLYIRKEFREFVSVRKEKGFKQRICNVLDLSDKQTVELDSIFTYHAITMEDLHNEFRKKFKKNMDSLETEIEPYLTEEQKQTLVEMKKTHRRFRKPFLFRKFKKDCKELTIKKK
ncbi:MAG: hypothetical protein IMY72_10125 [Bacteroidetes bacterium]|nr:hypothetical protein [Bacteroidota bacterium]